MTTPRHKGSQQNTLPELRTCLLRNTQLNSSDIGIAKISWLSLNALRGKFPLWSHTIFFCRSHQRSRIRIKSFNFCRL